LAERPGILLWSIVGWKRLHETGHFIQPEAGDEMLGDLEDLSSPIGAFVRECCDIGAGCRVPVTPLFNRWEEGCQSKGRNPGNEQTFGRDLLAAVQGIRKVRPRNGEERIRAYENIGLKS